MTPEDKQWFEQQLQGLKEYIDERSRGIETTLLKEFHKWAPRLEGRLINAEARLSVLEQRVDELDERRGQ